MNAAVRATCRAALLSFVGLLASPAAAEKPHGCVVQVHRDAQGNPLRAAVPAGPRTVLILVVDFNDATVAGSLNLPDPEAFVAGVMYDDVKNAAGLIAEASFGLTTLESDADGDGRHDIFSIAIDDTIVGESCVINDWADAADAEAQALGVNLGLYQHRMYVIPNVTGGCISWGGQGEIGCDSTCRTWIRSTAYTLFPHEIGHNLGMHHASTDPDNDGEVDAEYGDGSDIMGSLSDWRQFNGPHMVEMNWLPPSQVVDLFGGGIQTFTLDALETDPAAALHPQVVRISRPDHPGLHYYLSYRIPVGYDTTMIPVHGYRLQVHTALGPEARTLYIDGLDDGESFSDPVAHDLVVTQLSHDNQTVTFEVQRTEPDLDADGFGETVDCDDENAAVYPGAPEVCDYLDNNCDDEVDEGFDACDIDMDGFDETVDCDDEDPTRYPGATELCDSIDNDCDGEADEPDWDGDGVGNCLDACPLDPDKGEGGFHWCACGVFEGTDEDGDQIPDCADNCPGDPNPGTTDSDFDGFADCYDQCPNDSTKWNPERFGQCPCGVPDVDSDFDFVYDCHDLCPGEDDRIDGDLDGLGDCADLCPTDPWKWEPGVCGCDAAEQDGDGDAVCDTSDNCPLVVNPSQADPDGDGVGHACDCGPGDPSNDSPIGPAWAFRFLSSGSVEWQPPAETGGGSPSYDLLRSTVASDFSGAECIVSDTTATSASVTNPPGDLDYFLVRVRGDCGSHLGLTSFEFRRTALQCP